MHACTLSPVRQEQINVKQHQGTNMHFNMPRTICIGIRRRRLHQRKGARWAARVRTTRLIDLAISARYSESIRWFSGWLPVRRCSDFYADIRTGGTHTGRRCRQPNAQVDNEVKVDGLVYWLDFFCSANHPPIRSDS